MCFGYNKVEKYFSECTFAEVKKERQACVMAFKWNVRAKWTTTRAGHVKYLSAFKVVAFKERTDG